MSLDGTSDQGYDKVFLRVLRWEMLKNGKLGLLDERLLDSDIVIDLLKV